MSASPGPRVSFVAASRNDLHGGDPARRTEIFVHGLAALAKRHALDAELVLVEWNTPPDRPPLGEALRWPEPGPLAVRVVTVSPELHRRVKNSDRIPFFQMMAKNVGIRRARGAFVVATNIDLLLSGALVEFLARGPLSERAVYRIDRLDVRLRDLPPGLSIDEQLAVCSMNVARVNSFEPEVEADPARLRARYGHDATPWRGFAPGEIESLLAGAMHAEPHFGAAGDFTLLARDAWLALRGYLELPLYSLHLDSILLKMALVAGLEQIVLPDPMRLYHIEHGMGWSVIGDRQRIAEDRPMLSDAQVARWLEQLDRAGRPLAVNGEDFGLCDVSLAEWSPSGTRAAA
jgi:hypothetical protein